MTISRTDVVSFSAHDEIGLIEINHPPVNAIAHPVREGVASALERAIADRNIRALLLVTSGPIFMAGADINELGRPVMAPSLQELESAIESARLPVVAAIQGLALGGGLELAMACHYRIAAPDARLGLPEITLGLIPGAGGTQRLPRLVGAARALDLMLSGKPWSAQEACAFGLVDEVAGGDLRAAARAWCERLIAEHRPPRRTCALGPSEPLTEELAQQALQTHARSIRGLRAPTLLIEAVRAAAQPFERGIAIEAGLSAQSLQLRESVALRHLFFAERAAAKLREGEVESTPRAIRRAAIIGAGTMGSGIATAFADAGVQVTLIDNAEAGLRRGMGIVQENFAAAVKRGRIDQSTAAERLARIQPGSSLSDAAGTDVVIEAVYEDSALKKSVLSQLDQLLPADRLIASNTSTLSVTDLAAATTHPGRLVGLHFFSPAHVMKLVEVVRGASTSAAALAAALQVSRLLKKTAVIANDGFGFIGNRMMLDGYFREAEQLLLEGAEPADVDRALEEFGFAMGPQRVSDLGGTDVGTRVRQELFKRASRPDPYFVIADQLTALGRLGQKSGSGFYRYESGSRQGIPDPEVERVIRELAAARGIEQRKISAAEIIERCVLSLILVGARVLEEGVAARAADIDVVWTNGYGFPRSLGGPMFHADTLGLRHVAERIRYYHQRCGFYWTPSALIERLAEAGQSFQQRDESGS
ncbi:MAG TPA: 3-hydroxyacyl-CoA dehydrogenase NAD-binding domain-containing protein [Steroidobacteraceae bacterium]|nr:3-hydroxyacyl-CoA dehydrogenase NAD-binding domain-containing protein [Steroidobacteraceae bacterium]